MNAKPAIYHRWAMRILLVAVLLSACGKANIKVQTFVPQGGQLGSQITLTGAGFSSDPGENEVTIGGLPATVVSASGKELVIEVPAGVTRAKIKVSRSWRLPGESKTDFILLPEYVQYHQFDSPTLNISQGYWLMLPPGFEDGGATFPVVYALHGYGLRNPISPEFGQILQKISLVDPGEMGEHSWLFGVKRAGNYFPFIAHNLMKSNDVEEFEANLTADLAAVAGDLDDVTEVVASILFYLPDEADDWLPLTEMIIAMPDGDASFYVDRLGPAAGRNADGLGAEPSFPPTPGESPAGRLDTHVTGWYSTYIMEDVITQVEDDDMFVDKLVDEEQRRFIMGISMGGFGCLQLAIRHADKFVAVAALGTGTSPSFTPEAIYMHNLLFPEKLDIYGSAPMAFGTSQEDLEANVDLDEDYIAAHNPMAIMSALAEIDLNFYLEIGENDISDGLIDPTIAQVKEFISLLESKGIPITGGVVPAATGGEPGNGNADHVQEFWRTRFGAILKFFSDIHESGATFTAK